MSTNTKMITLPNPDEDASGATGSSDNENEKTIIQVDLVAELKEEIRTLKESFKMLTMTTATSQPHQQAYAHQLPTGTTENLPNNVAIPATTTDSSYVHALPPDNNKISISPFSLPSSYMPYYSNVQMPRQYVPLSTQTPPFNHIAQSILMPPHTTTTVPSQTNQMYNYSPYMPINHSQTNTTTCPTSSTTRPVSTTAATNWTMPRQDYQPFRKLFDLPEFNGQPEQWPMFSVSYNETTQYYGYSNLENLFRLQKSLKGDARSKVEAYLIHPESVEQIMKTLEFHYGRPHIIIRSQIAKVRGFPAISGRKISDIINFSTMVSNLTMFLENAGATPHLCNPTLVDELVNKLPLTKREEWVKYSMCNLDQYPSVRQFSEWLQNVATYISLAVETDGSTEDFSKNIRARTKQSFVIATDDRSQTSCVNCQNNHHLSQCSKFKNAATAERWKIVKDNHLCFCCMKTGHTAFKCTNRRQCGISNCLKFHNRLLHENKNVNTAEVNKNKQTNESARDHTESITLNVVDIDESSVSTIIDNDLNIKSLFKFLPVTLKGPKGTQQIMAFIDDGSKVSLLEEDVAKELGFHGPKNNLTLGWIGGRKSIETSMTINLEIGGTSERGNCFQMRNVRTTSNLKLPPQSLQLDKFKKRFPQLQKVFIEDYVGVTPKLLIGLPHIKLVRPHQVINLDENFSVHMTNLGNILFGSNEEVYEHSVFVIEYNVLDDIKQHISNYFSLESFGMNAAEPVMAEADKRAANILVSTTKRIGNQYETGLLWKQDIFEHKKTYYAAFKRLQNVELKMKKDKELAEWYNNKIEEYVLKGYARKLEPAEVSINTDRTWYLPHFVVVNVNKGNKRRLVFDAAARVEDESFNTRLLKGPAEYQPKPLLSILFKFRQRKYGICGDIREMFHRVRIREQDQQAQRFLWRSGESDKPPDIFVMQAMIFGSVCSPCSAQYVKNLNAKRYEKTDARAYRAIVDCHYVDDYVDSFDTIEEGITVTKNVLNIQREAGFELRGFISNSTDLCCALQDEDVACELKDLCKSENNAEKVLGLFWSPEDDTFRFILKFSHIPEAVREGKQKPTKSQVLSMVMSIFDPFGFLANVVIRSKLILQEIWNYNVDWNSTIPDELYQKWRAWYIELQNVKDFKFPRCYDKAFSDLSASIELHIFADASELAFAAVGYWRISHNGNIKVVFIAGKSRCAPLKPLSIPRLELQAAVLGVRLKEAIISSHDVKPNRIVFWSDSKTVIKWIQSDSRIYKQFVSHRIGEILEFSEVSQWRWVPGLQNPADDATRPQFFSGKVKESRWLHGPCFLKCNESDWPISQGDADKQICDAELRSKFILSIAESDHFIPYESRSKYRTLIRVTCWVIRAARIFKTLGKKLDKSTLKLPSYLTSEEIKEAEVFWCKKAQQEDFKSEYDILLSEGTVNSKSHIYKLSPFLGEDGLIRISGRINNARCVEEPTKQPIILPKSHVITRIIVNQYHNDFRHQNQESICAAVRTKFWVPSLRQLVRSVKKSCQECKNRSAVAMPPLMGQLPVDRISPFVRPFSYTGIDYLGPYLVSIGRRNEKRWVALFTCMTTRAIHLELSRDLSTDAVILCLRNFINRRGVPVRIRSDRGTNFIGASKEEFVLSEAGLADECTKRGIEWVFNVPADPSAGGAWERMVRAVKNVLSFTLKEKCPQVDTLNSLLIEAENLVNSRPLTHLPIESVDSEPLTPNNFLLGCPNIVQTPAVGEKVVLRKQWHILQQIKQTFWKRWVLEYLPELTRRTKWHKRVKPLEVGNVVVICDENEARGQWKRGVVVRTFPGADGQVRSALVRTSVGHLRRPASRLAVLDVCSESP
ncbi:uncharacterized protein LOC142230970 [Haematobia irritans]|uniref:uncharacterized protein LOC142230970 n=1 Tax=Haematobia irritans TaxID=7368 RepID=UPI003F4F6A7F